MRALLVVISLVALQAKAEPCPSALGTQRQLEEMTQRIMSSQEAEFKKAFKASERAWMRYRDSVLEARYPGRNKKERWGSAYSDCHCALLAQLTQSRLQDIKIWDDGIEEGDVCAGSVKRK